MAFVLTNDDGIDAPGLQALVEAIKQEIIIVAPKDHHSGCGHQVTTHRPIRLDRRNMNVYAVEGTPVDCTRLALAHVSPQTKWLLSGINAGGNLGVDSYISGTVAAAREAAIHNVPSIAISQVIRRPLVIDWQLASRWTTKVLTKLWQKPLPAKHFWNVNFPPLVSGSPDPEVVFCEPSNCPLPLKYEIEGDFFHYVGEYSDRDRQTGTDVDICFSGKIAVTLLKA